MGCYRSDPGWSVQRVVRAFLSFMVAFFPREERAKPGDLRGGLASLGFGLGAAVVPGACVFRRGNERGSRWAAAIHWPSGRGTSRRRGERAASSWESELYFGFSGVVLHRREPRGRFCPSGPIEIRIL